MFVSIKRLKRDLRECRVKKFLTRQVPWTMYMLRTDSDSQVQVWSHSPTHRYTLLSNKNKSKNPQSKINLKPLPTFEVPD